MRLFALFALAAILSLAGTARADNRFQPLPADAKAKKDPKQLTVRVVSYDGAVNGELTVEVKNTSKSAAQFTAAGLYFVPGGNADEAPQRLGAVGPFVLVDEPAERRESVTVAPGKTVRLTLDVFCIDSHRSSPSSETSFAVGRSRMPAKLAGTIDKNAKKAAAEAGGFAQPTAKGAVQSEVWKARDAKWIKLDGEGKQEATK